MNTTHTVRVPLPADIDPAALAARYAEIIGRLGRPELPRTLWIDQVPIAVAEGRLAAELALPVSCGLRGVLLRGADRSDLVLAADRGLASRDDLDALAALVSGGTGPDPAWTDRPASAVPVVAPEWGLGGVGGGTGELDLGPWAADAEPATWLAALSIVLARYGGGVAAATLDTTTSHAVDAFEGGDMGTVAELVERFRTPESTSDDPVSVGLVFGTDAPAGGAYRPWDAPPFPLTIGVGRARLRHEHGTGVTAEIAAQFVRHLAHTHEQVVTAPGMRAADVDLFDDEERERITALGGAATTHALGPAVRIEECFAARAAERPEAIALCHEQERLTYRELDELSTRFAAGLRRVGVRTGDRVGIGLDRSTNLVTTMLAVLKAGAVYVPLDPSYPAERLSYIVEDAGLEVVVTTSDDFPGHAGLRHVHPDELSAPGAHPAVHDPSTEPTDPAYVTYTSGSTGRPKGVVVPHANVIALLDATRDDFGLSPADVWTLFHSSAFDFSVWEIWGCLLTGARLVVVPFWISRSPEECHGLLVDEQVTVLNQTPSAFSQLLAVDRVQQRPLAVRLVVFGGEPLDTRMLLPWFDRYPETRCRMVNMFGITETTVHVTAETITRSLALAASRSVGPALPGWYVHVLGPDGRLAPPGVRGEIHVGGAGVACGYLNRPELDAERFVADPFGGDHGTGRLYRSGDAGRLRPDGRLEHLGRIDSQVKIRGFRIELDEIRSVLWRTGR